jgi:hypothetical protein
LVFSTTRIIKGAALADFVAEWTEAPDQDVGEDRPLAPGDEAPDGWIMHFDGAFAHQGAGAGAVHISPTKDKLFYAMQLCFQNGEKVSNNIAEYEGLIAGLKATAVLGMHRRRGDLPSFPASDGLTCSVAATVNTRHHGGLQPRQSLHLCIVFL